MNSGSLTSRERIFLIMSITLLLGFFAVSYAAQLTINDYANAYTECMNAYNAADRGFIELWSKEEIYENLTPIIKNINSTK